MKKIFLILFVFLSAFSLFAQKLEAEDGDAYSAKTTSSISGFSGKGYVDFLPGGSSFVKITFKTKKSSNYAFKLTYSADSEKPSAVKVEIDDKYLVTQKLQASDSFTNNFLLNTALLEKGQHTVKVTGYRGKWSFDSIEVIEADDKLISQIKNKRLVNPNAIPEAQKLFEYLCQMQGKGILSGQQIYGQNTQEIKTLLAATGKNPAVLGIDLIDFSPSRVEHGASGGRLTSVAKKYWDEGGIITCAWHWNAPSGLIDKDMPEMHWYDGFRTKATTFDFSKGIKDHESEEYKLMIRDIDAIAKQLKILAKNNIPVLWRPIHEASGKWFWWGAKGPENYIELYKLMYDRLVNYHGLNNLIWVWNAQDPDWYPGDEYVDVLSYDYYPMKYKHGTADEYLAKIQAATDKAKLYAISENGALPNVVKLEEEKSLWSWWCTWNGDFTVAADGKSYSESNTSLDSLKLYYNNPYTITRDELPSFKVSQ